jgi:chromosome segregation ATPase
MASRYEALQVSETKSSILKKWLAQLRQDLSAANSDLKRTAVSQKIPPLQHKMRELDRRLIQLQRELELLRIKLDQQEKVLEQAKNQESPRKSPEERRLEFMKQFYSRIAVLMNFPFHDYDHEMAEGLLVGLEAKLQDRDNRADKDLVKIMARIRKCDEAMISSPPLESAKTGTAEYRRHLAKQQELLKQKDRLESTIQELEKEKAGLDTELSALRTSHEEQKALVKELTEVRDSILTTLEKRDSSRRLLRLSKSDEMDSAPKTPPPEEVKKPVVTPEHTSEELECLKGLKVLFVADFENGKRRGIINVLKEHGVDLKVGSGESEFQAYDVVLIHTGLIRHADYYSAIDGSGENRIILENKSSKSSVIRLLLEHLKRSKRHQHLLAG